MRTKDESGNFQLMKMLGTEIKISLWCELKTISFFKIQASEINLPELSRLVRKIIIDSRTHIENMTTILHNISMSAETRDCDFVNKIIKEYFETKSEDSSSEFYDQHLIDLLLKIVHYKIVLYTTAQDLSKTLGLKEFAVQFKESLENTKITEQELNEILTTKFITH